MSCSWPCCVGLVAALLPAIQAYRTDIAAVLASRA